MIYQNIIHRFKQEYNKYLEHWLLSEESDHSKKIIEKLLYTSDKANAIFNLSDNNAELNWYQLKYIFTGLESKMYKIEKMFKNGDTK